MTHDHGPHHTSATCPICQADNRQEPMRQLVDEARAGIERVGWYCMFIFGSEETPPFTYTIGLGRTFNHPDFMISGLHANQSHPLMTQMVNSLRDGKRFETRGRQSQILREYDTFLAPLSASTCEDRFGFGTRVLEEVPSMMQIAWPDAGGRFPWEQGYDSLPQEILFTPPAGARRRRA